METVYLKNATSYPLRHFLMGEYLIWPRQPKHRLFVLVSGAVEICRGEVVLGRVSTPGSLFGEVSSLTESDPIATVRAVIETSAHEIEDVDHFLSQKGVALHLVQDMAERLKIAGENIQPFT